jgi:hypothetical protein
VLFFPNKKALKEGKRPSREGILRQMKEAGPALRL